MTDANPSSNTQWTSVQAYVLAVICLLVGIAGGWLVRGSQSPAAAVPNVAGTSAVEPAGSQMPSPEQLKAMAETQAAPLIEKLKTDPANADLLAAIGNTYYDAQQYPAAIDYYGRALKVNPADAGVRTDMGTAYWYMGNADTAIAEFDKALSAEPNKANTLFNRGLVKWRGKMDIKGAVADWEKLLATNPNYEGKDKVEQMIAEARKHSDVKSGAKAAPLAE